LVVLPVCVTRHPPTPPPFPYTTLFRSRADTPLVLDADALNLLAGGALPGWGPGPVVLTPHAAEGARLLGVSTQAVLADRLGAARDRKSTRLNSSHVKISYAVFCLKKKK